MNGTGRLSLRARLLVVLIAVTAAFLLIMGGVTAFVLSKRLGTQFDDSLISAAARAPEQIQANPGDYVAVVISRFPLTVQPLTGSGGATETLAHAVERSAAAGNFLGYVHDTPFGVPGTSPRLRAVARFLRLSRSGVVAQPGRAGRGRRLGVLVVARPVGAITGQVGGIVVAELITGGALILLLVLGGRWLIGRALAPLSEMAGTAQRITTQGDLTARMPDADASTEVGKLGAAVNTMLDRIQQAFGARLRSEAKVRQFAADASHELRTPLTTIRGYAELYRQGALGHDQLPDAMRRIEQEARRMSTLVAELLELARLDRTSSLDIADTDLAVLVRDAVADARAVEPGRPVRAEAPDSLVAAVDEARIRQVLANLLGNVREHTPVATPTAVRLAQVRGGVVLEVADGGPGMAGADAARAFDRFYRGAERNNDGPGASRAVGYGTEYGPGTARSASSRSANGSGEAAESGGSGLGLAIVAAIAQAHGGQATLESAPGRGTRVRVWLPATPPAPPRAAPAPRSRLSHAGRHPSAAAPAPRSRLSHAGRHSSAAAPATQQPGSPRPGHAGPAGGQPLPARRPRGASGRAAVTRSPGPPCAAAPAAVIPRHRPPPSATPAAVPRPGQLSGPAVRAAVTAPGRRPLADARRPPAPPGPLVPSTAPARPGELHHNWGDPPRLAPPASPPLPQPGRHRHAWRGLQPPEAG